MRLHRVGRVASLAELLPQEQLQEAEAQLGTPLPQVFQSAKTVCGDGLSDESLRRLQEPNPWTILLPQTLTDIGVQTKTLSRTQDDVLSSQPGTSEDMPDEQAQEQDVLQSTSDPSSTSATLLQASLFEEL